MFTAALKHCRLPGAVLVTFLLLVGVPATGASAEADRIPVGYEFATWLGTGLYRIGGRDVWILNFPIKYELSEAAERRVGARVLLPVSLGWLDSRGIDSDDLQTATFIPGLELTYKPWSWWTLHGFAQTGIGRDFDGDNNVWVYAGGLKSRIDMDRGEYTFSLGNAFVAAGSESDGVDSSFSRFDVGIGVKRPMGWQLFGRGTKINVFYVASLFSDDAGFVSRLKDDRSNVGTVHNFGLALGVQPSLRLFGFKLKWLGLSYLTGNNIKGVRINGGFPF
ncbi:hypothetical protein Thimo_3561 [Thioflavicoccus mobilis 8321]|uniref:Outer membrane protein beta-barrel domain-containing protein n=1 Tax=Thioflavicoccus mobilis 8321 TaxID=765912 RepID=L0GZN8_9GAMM|nr:hypothetical protein [Thioflavicoccus mobilis]AGA92218.1 hypothetical protein Thimo_3561 [Thioflavicoccus mobilis 8321]